MIVFIDLYESPSNWRARLHEMGCYWGRAEPQLIADQVKLHGFSKPEGVNLPSWARIGGARGPH